METEAVLLFGVATVWVAVEVPVIFTATRAILPGGAERLTKLGALFLGTEAWTLILIGASHGMIPETVHELLHSAGLALIVFVAGWMIRDLGLWLGPHNGAGRQWRTIVTIGGSLQILGILGLVSGLILLRPELAVGSVAPMITWVTPPVVVVGVVLLGAIKFLRRGGYFTWNADELQR